MDVLKMSLRRPQDDNVFLPTGLGIDLLHVAVFLCIISTKIIMNRFV